jgi:2-polyprenyl-3-methyl-5-hydroxy-6-metoxy-1,4-benzoquinol methylase
MTTPSAFDENYQYFQQVGRAGKYSVPWWSANFYARLVRRYARPDSRGCVLEIGCGLGWVLQNLENEYDTFGMDISEYAIQVAQKNSPRSQLRVGDDSILRDYPDAHFDAIVSKHVFEHIAKPGDTLRECARLLKPNGVLIFGTPNTESPLKKLKGANWIGIKDPTHISVLTPSEWVRLTQQAGLNVLASFSDGLWDVPYLPVIPPLLQLPIFGIPAALQVIVGIPFIPVKWGESLIVLARKK